MAEKCSQPSCFPDETGCNVEGCERITDCEFYNKDLKTDHSSKNSDDDMLHVPWTSSSFGLEDLNFLTASSPTVLIGITGAANAGKTTFLAVLYCLIRHGYAIGEYQFCGSKTLSGWENLAWYLSWKRDNDIQFPPHTSSNSGRVPGLLHLSLKNKVGLRKDIIFTDAPGEWFDKWSYNKNDSSAEGAKWIHQRADAFLLFADCELLSGEEQGRARRQTRLVADRLSENLRDRPFGLIWSKSDIELDSDIKGQISNYMARFHHAHYKEFNVSVQAGEKNQHYVNIVNSISWILDELDHYYNPIIEVPVLIETDLFISKRSYHG
ncbi:hypothetical protein GCM10027592_63000 [Spirosoma flavus]